MADVMERLSAANPVRGCSPPSIDEVWRRLEERGKAGELLTRDRSARADRSPRRRRPDLAVVAAGLSVLVVLAVFVGALALLHHRGAARETSAASPRALFARLAVLRRPQTPADRLPADAKLQQGGRLLPGLTRLVATPPDVRLYLVVTRPRTGPHVLWSPKLGDQVSIVGVSRYGTTQTTPIPAVDLAYAQQFGLVGVPIADVAVPRMHRGGVSQAVARRDDYAVAIVPDEVAYVRWTLGQRGKPVGTLRLPAKHNIVYGQPWRRGSAPGTPLRATWYAANGTVIPTSDRALRETLAAEQNRQRSQLIRAYSRHPHRAPASLLADFSVFSITSRAGVTTPSGLSISRPPWSSLPLWVLRILASPGAIQPDLAQVREITTAAGLTAWVIPGTTGICIFGMPRSVRSRYTPEGGGGTGGCAINLAQAEQGGTGVGAADGLTWQVLPKTKPTTRIRTAQHGWQTIRPPYGVYIGPS